MSPTYFLLIPLTIVIIIFIKMWLEIKRWNKGICDHCNVSPWICVQDKNTCRCGNCGTLLHLTGLVNHE